MQGSDWVQLLQRIPEKQHENLVLVTTAGAEVMVQRIICHESNYMILRGRPAGSTEVARTILLPFDQLNYLAFHKPLREQDVLAMFATDSTVVSPPPGKPDAAEIDASVAAATEDSVATTGGTADVAQTTDVVQGSDASPPPAPEKASVKSLSKSVLLERLRARLGKS